MPKKFEALRAKMSRRSREAAEGIAAHQRLLQGSIEAEEEKLGLYVGTEGLPRDNPAHRERYGLDGAWDAHCEDVCCAPAKLADVSPVEDSDYAPRCTYCGSTACPSLNYIPELGRRPLCPRLPSCRLKKAA